MLPWRVERVFFGRVRVRSLADENNCRLLPDPTGRSFLETIQPDADPERGLPRADRYREPGCAALAFAAQEREHIALAHPRRGVLLCPGRRGPDARRRRNPHGAKVRRCAGRARPVAPGIQRYRYGGALADHRRAGGAGISARFKLEDRPLGNLSGRPETIARRAGGFCFTAATS